LEIINKGGLVTIGDYHLDTNK